MYTVSELEADKEAELSAAYTAYDLAKAEIDREYQAKMRAIDTACGDAEEAAEAKYAPLLNEADLQDCPKCHGTRVWHVERPERGEDEHLPCPERTYDGASTHGQPIVDAREDAAVEAHHDRLTHNDWMEMGR
jgi:DNA-directed RNA polymerase subunit M/transcription elongation factor TFIIS